MLHTHSFTYHPRYIMFLSQYFSFPLSVPFHQRSIPIHSPTTHTIYCFSPSTSVFPRQYHSTNAPYPFIHLPPTLYNVPLPVLQFSPVSTIPPTLHTHSFTYHPHIIMFLFQYFSFPLSVSFHQCSMLICIQILLLPERQASRDGEPWNKATLLRISRTTGQKNNCTLFGTVTLFTYTIPSSVRLPQQFSRFTDPGDLTINSSKTQDTDHCSGPA